MTNHVVVLVSCLFVCRMPKNKNNHCEKVKNLKILSRFIFHLNLNIIKKQGQHTHTHSQSQ